MPVVTWADVALSVEGVAMVGAVSGQRAVLVEDRAAAARVVNALGGPRNFVDLGAFLVVSGRLWSVVPDERAVRETALVPVGR